MKKFLCLVLVCVMFFAFALEASAQEDISIALIFKTLNSEYWGTMADGSREAAEELGVEAIILGPTAESEIAQQVTQIEEQLATDIDAIVVAPCEENAVIGALTPAVGKLPIIAVDSNFGLEGKAAFIGTGNKSAAKTGGVWVAEKLGKGCKAVLIGGQQGEGTSTARLDGYREGLEEGGCEVLDTQYGHNTADGAIGVMEDLLTRFPGEIDAVLSMNDDMAIGCQQAIANAGVEGITIVGFDGNQSAVELIADGKLGASVAQQPKLMGRIAVEQAVKAAKGETIEEEQDVPTILITAENAEEFLAK